MSSGCGLSGLMKYRFQKREEDKLVTSPTGHDRKSDGQSPPTPKKKSLKPVPETPERDRPPPESPIFNSVKKTKQSSGDTIKAASSPEDSPQWLSKASLKTSNPAPSTSSQSSQDSVTSSEHLTDEDRVILSDISSLQSLFPQRPRDELLQAMAAADNNYDRAVNFLMDQRFSPIVAIKPKHKRSREASHTSSLSSPDVSVKRVYKRARIISSDEDSDDDIQTANGQPPTSSQSSLGQFSLTSSAGAANGSSQDSVSFLQGAFPLLPRQILIETLKKCNNDADEATSKLTEMCKNGVSQTKNVGSIKAMKDARTIAIATGHGGSLTDDHDKMNKASKEGKEKVKKKRQFTGDVEEIGSDEDWNDDPIDSSDEEYLEEDEHTGQNAMVIKFLNEAAISDLLGVAGCSKKKAEIIMEMRPFSSCNDLVTKFGSTKSVSMQLIAESKVLLRIRHAVQNLMKKCEKISRDLDSVISELTSKTDLDLEQSDSEYIRKQPKILNENLQLKPYQLVGLNWLVVMHEQELNGILGDEMGLGKTIQTIAFLAHMKECEEPGPHLIIAPSSTLDNWLRELKVWCPSLNVLLYYGSQEERTYLRQQISQGHYDDFDVAVTTYNMATGSVEDRNMFKKFSWHYAVFDEGHMLKNMSSMRYKTLMRIKAERRLLLTGTPLQNNLIELMSLLAFVMPDLFTGKTDHLKRIFASMTGKSTEEQQSSYEAENIAHAKRILHPFFLRRQKVDVLKQLPKKTEKIHHVPMVHQQQELYNDLKHKFSETMKDNRAGVTGQSGAAMMMQLRKAANHPMLHRCHYDLITLRRMAKDMLKEPTHTDSVEQYVYEDMEVMSDFELHRLCKQYRSLHKYKLDDDLILDSGKFHFLDSMLPQLKEQGSRVLLFSQFTMMLDVIEVYMKKRNYKFIRLDGQTPVAERQDLIDSFNNDESIFVFLLSTKAGGLGINLTAANVVVLHDIDFNPYNDKQAEDRCHRLGQKRDVIIHRLLCANTIEEGMWKCAQAKLKLEKDVTGSNKGDKVDSNDVASLIREALSQGTS